MQLEHLMAKFGTCIVGCAGYEDLATPIDRCNSTVSKQLARSAGNPASRFRSGAAEARQGAEPEAGDEPGGEAARLDRPAGGGAARDAGTATGYVHNYFHKVGIPLKQV